MGQIIQFIVTIIHDPQLLVLDEPFAGLDPVNTELLKGMLADLRNQGKAVILSTHQMNQVEELCDRILMINNGQDVLYGDLSEIKADIEVIRCCWILKVSWGRYRELPVSELTKATLS